MAKASADQPSVATTTAQDKDRYLSLAQLVEYSGLSGRTLSRHLHDPNHPLPSYRVGTRVLVRKSDFDRWIEAVSGDEADRDARAWVRKLAKEQK